MGSEAEAGEVGRAVAGEGGEGGGMAGCGGACASYVQIAVSFLYDF